MATILLTRPEEECQGTKKALEERGHKVMVAPMIRVLPNTFEVPDQSRSLIITSKNAVRYGLKNLPDIERSVYAVGAATAKAADDAGFQRVVTGPGTVKGLMPLLTTPDKHPNRYTYLRGEEISYDIVGALQAEGIEADSQVVYTAVPEVTVPPEVEEALDVGAIDMVLFYSPRLATNFEEMVADQDRIDWLQKLDAYCLSTRVYEQLMCTWRDKHYALMPNEKAMLDLIGYAG